MSSSFNSEFCRVCHIRVGKSDVKRMSSAFTSLATMIFSLIVAAALLRLDVADGSPRKDAAPALLKIRDLMRGMPKNQDLIYEKNLPELRDAKKDHPFDHLTLTQQWPATACLNAGHHRCVSDTFPWRFCPRRNLQFRGGLYFDVAGVVCVCVCVCPGANFACG